MASKEGAIQMRLSAILMSRVIALGGAGEADPFGQVFLPSLLTALVERYQFQKFPTALGQLDLSAGVVLEGGYAEECGTISKLTIFKDGWTMEARSQTSQTKAALLAIFQWLADAHNLTYNEHTIKRWLYVTSLFFYSDADLDLLNPILLTICKTMEEYTVGTGRPRIPFKTSRIAVDFDRASLDFPQAPFVIERDKTMLFGEHRYFSESPMPSELHIALLEEVERGILQRKLTTH